MNSAIATQRLVIRPLAVADVTPPYVAGMNDPEVTRQTEAYGRVWSLDDIVKYVATSNTPGVSELHGLFLAVEGRHIGNIRLSAFSPRHQRCELGFMIFDKQQWGRGLGSEALAAITAHALGAKGLHRVCADYHAGNLGSARVFAKVGFQIEGVYRDHFRVDGRYVDSVRMAKLATT